MNRLFADDGCVLARPVVTTRPPSDGLYWLKVSKEDKGGWTKPVWLLCTYYKEGKSGFRESCINAIFHSNLSPSFWGDESDEVQRRYTMSIVVDWEGPLNPPAR